MKLRHDQLLDQLKKSLAPIYFISGDEILLVNEACEAVRAQAQQAGFAERNLFVAEDNHFDPAVFQAHSDNLSLFASKKLIELYCLTEKIPEKLAQALLAYAQAPNPDNCLLIRCGKLASGQQNTAWFKALVQAAMVVQIWPLEFSRLPQWIMQRLKKLNLSCDEAGLRLLAQRGENNLFSLAQEIEKLHLLYGEGKLSAQQITEAIEDQARYQLFDLTEPVLQGNKERALRILMKLQEEGVEPPLILWLLSKEIRELIQGTPSYGKPSPALERKKMAAAQALKRHSISRWQQFLKTAFDVDQLIKGAQSGNVWEALQRWILQMT